MTVKTIAPITSMPVPESGAALPMSRNGWSQSPQVVAPGCTFRKALRKEGIRGLSDAPLRNVYRWKGFREQLDRACRGSAGV